MKATPGRRHETRNRQLVDAHPQPAAWERQRCRVAPDGSAIYYDRIEAVPQGIYSVPVLGGDERLVFPQAFRPEALRTGVYWQ